MECKECGKELDCDIVVDDPRTGEGHKEYEKCNCQETVSIPKWEYEKLLDMEHKLACLEAAGVDNWSGYSDAVEMMQEEE